MTLTLPAILSEGRLELLCATPVGDCKSPTFTLGEVEALVAYARLEIARHLQQRDAANSTDARLSLEEAETALMTAMQGIGSACAFIDLDMWA